MNKSESEEKDYNEKTSDSSSNTNKNTSFSKQTTKIKDKLLDHTRIKCLYSLAKDDKNSKEKLKNLLKQKIYSKLEKTGSTSYIVNHKNINIKNEIQTIYGEFIKVNKIDVDEELREIERKKEEKRIEEELYYERLRNKHHYYYSRTPKSSNEIQRFNNASQKESKSNKLLKFTVKASAGESSNRKPGKNSYNKDEDDEDLLDNSNNRKLNETEGNEFAETEQNIGKKETHVVSEKRRLRKEKEKAERELERIKEMEKRKEIERERELEREKNKKINEKKEKWIKNYKQKDEDSHSIPITNHSVVESKCLKKTKKNKIPIGQNYSSHSIAMLTKKKNKDERNTSFNKINKEDETKKENKNYNERNWQCNKTLIKTKSFNELRIRNKILKCNNNSPNENLKNSLKVKSNVLKEHIHKKHHHYEHNRPKKIIAPETIDSFNFILRSES